MEEDYALDGLQDFLEGSWTLLQSIVVTVPRDQPLRCGRRVWPPAETLSMAIFGDINFFEKWGNFKEQESGNLKLNWQYFKMNKSELWKVLEGILNT